MPTRPPAYRPREATRPPPPPRPSSARRGYGSHWRRLRALVLAGEPLCRQCGSNGIITEATEVDHIVAIAKGGSVSDLNNLMPLCKSCHSAKTVREDGGLGMA